MDLNKFSGLLDFNAVHGTCRVMSRTKSAGRKKKGKSREGIRRLNVIKKGCTDYDDVRKDMSKRRIELRGGDADETPECYKDLDEVLKYQGDSIKILYRLHPIGAAMAGPDTWDPYFDGYTIDHQSSMAQLSR